VLGVQIETLTTETEIEVEVYTVSQYERGSKKYEKMKLQTVETTIKNEKYLFPIGTYKIPMDQRRANIILEVLEPEAPNSFVSFGVIETKTGEILPIYRKIN